MVDFGQMFNYVLLNYALIFVIFISLLIALLMNLIYKWMTDQNLMKSLKDEMKKYQQDMKKESKDPKKVMEIQKKSMEVNMKYMSSSLKPSFITLIPALLIFAWLGSVLSYDPITPGQTFTTTVVFENGISGNMAIVVPPEINVLENSTKEIKDGKVVWKLIGKEGEYLIEYKYNEKSYKKESLITAKQEFKMPLQKIGDKTVKTISIDNNPKKIMNLFGWKLGWIGTYIIFSLIFSMLLRKILKVY